MNTIDQLRTPGQALNIWTVLKIRQTEGSPELCSSYATRSGRNRRAPSVQDLESRRTASYTCVQGSSESEIQCLVILISDRRNGHQFADCAL